jgi:hypothetical protein
MYWTWGKEEKKKDAAKSDWMQGPISRNGF